MELVNGRNGQAEPTRDSTRYGKEVVGGRRSGACSADPHVHGVQSVSDRRGSRVLISHPHLTTPPGEYLYLPIHVDVIPGQPPCSLKGV